jgi:hypothetical protein
MKINRKFGRYLALILFLLSVSCMPTYKLTQTLDYPISATSTCAIGAITDELPEMDVEKKPTLEEVTSFKQHLHNKLNEYECLELIDDGEGETRYEISGGITEFKRGSGILRFLFGIFAGNAKLTVNLELEDKTTNEVIFGGKFWAEVGGGDWITPGNEVFEQVAKNFAKALLKQSKTIAKKAETEEAPSND